MSRSRGPDDLKRPLLDDEKKGDEIPPPPPSDLDLDDDIPPAPEEPLPPPDTDDEEEDFTSAPSSRRGSLESGGLSSHSSLTQKLAAGATLGDWLKANLQNPAGTAKVIKFINSEMIPKLSLEVQFKFLEKLKELRNLDFERKAYDKYLAKVAKRNPEKNVIEQEKAEQKLEVIAKKELKPAIKKINLTDLKLNANEWQQLITVLGTPPSDPFTKVQKRGDILNTPIIYMDVEHPNSIQIRDALEAHTAEGLGHYGLDKSGGKNDPGTEGGLYLKAYFAKNDDDPHLQIKFNKQPTDFENKKLKKGRIHNIQEGVAEIMTGRSMNRLTGVYSAPLFLEKIKDEKGIDQVYIASVYHQDFVPAQVAILGDKKRKGGFGFYGVSDKFKQGFADKVLGKQRMEQSFGETMAASILNGNYQYHEENIGFAKTWEQDKKTGKWNPVDIVASLDYGGGMRPDYNTYSGYEAQKKGRFERSVRPLKNANKKYHHAYLKNYPEAVLLSKGTIAGFDKIAHTSRALIVNGLKEDVDYVMKFYDKKDFYNHYVLPLDKRDKKFGLLNDLAKRGRNDTNRTSDEIRAAAIEYLVDNQIARQLSLQEFTLENKLKAAQGKAKEKDDRSILVSQQAATLLDNPVYSIKKDFEKKFKSALPWEKAPSIPMLVTGLVQSQGKGYAPFEKMMGILANEFEMAKFKHKNAMYDLVEVLAVRLEAAVQSLGGFAGTHELETQIKEINVFREYLNNVVKYKDYNSSEEQTILALACDESYRYIRDICYKYRNAPQLKSFVDAQWAITPRSNSAGTPEFENQRGIKTQKSIIEYKKELKELVINPHLAARTTASASVSAFHFSGLGGISSSRSPSPSASPRASISSGSNTSVRGSSVSLSDISPSTSPRTSISSTFFKSKPPYVLDDALANLVRSFGDSIQKYSMHDLSVKDCMKELSHFQKSSGGPISFSADFTTQMNSQAIALPQNVLRITLPIPLKIFNESYNTTYKKSLQNYSQAGVFQHNNNPASGILSNSANAMKSDEVTFNYIADNAAKSVSEKSASYLAVKTNNSYSIQAISLSPSLSRTDIIEDVFKKIGLKVTPKEKTEIRAILKDLEKSQTLYVEGELLNAINKKFTTGDITSNAELIERLLNDIKEKCYKKFGEDYVPADDYINNTKAHVEAFLAEAGSNKTIYISPTSDPLLAQAYILVCLTNNLAFKDESGNTPAQTDAIKNTWKENAELRQHVTKNFTIGALASVKSDLDSLVNNIKLTVAATPATTKALNSLNANSKLHEVTDVIKKITAAGSPAPSPRSPKPSS